MNLDTFFDKLDPQNHRVGLKIKYLMRYENECTIEMIEKLKMTFKRKISKTTDRMPKKFILFIGETK